MEMSRKNERNGEVRAEFSTAHHRVAWPLLAGMLVVAILLAGCSGNASTGNSRSGSEGEEQGSLKGAGAFSSNAPGSCSDKWVNSAVHAVTGVAPQGKVCDIYLYNNGSWSSYDQLEGAVRTRMSECSDRWVTQALIEVYGRGGYDKSVQCTINRYGGGQWNGYADLKAKVSRSMMCRDPWVGQAVFFATGRNPVGTGLTSRSSAGECNIYLYGSGRWSSFSGLQSEAQKTHANLLNANRMIDASGNFKNRSTGVTIHAADKGMIDLANSSSFANGQGQVIANGAGNVIANGAGNVIAVGAGNVIANGAGN